ncbi:hypothetical protein CLV88_1062 [Shimia abyssi]|uniref:Uncharacterized protein n=1 Tax=Shimia abyssi TaxID=1662395 RepID=A0A2P8FC37_9RHOB|nr:hypothetical protein CLV88_1062 [Shimia abyssi]
MAVRICMTSGRCFTCNTGTFDDVSSAVSGSGKWYCCPAVVTDYSFCVRVSDISSFEVVPKRPDPEPGKPNDPNISYGGSDNVVAHR